MNALQHKSTPEHVVHELRLIQDVLSNYVHTVLWGSPKKNMNRLFPRKCFKDLLFTKPIGNIHHALIDSGRTKCDELIDATWSFFNTALSATECFFYKTHTDIPTGHITFLELYNKYHTHCPDFVIALANNIEQTIQQVIRG